MLFMLNAKKKGKKMKTLCNKYEKEPAVPMNHRLGERQIVDHNQKTRRA